MNEHKTVLGKKNNLYRVCVNHQEIRLYDANVLYPPYGEVKQVPYGIVGISEAVSVTIEASFDVQKVEIQPVSLGFSQIVQNNTVTFCVTKPCSITVHVNDDLQKTLHLFFYDAQERFTYQKENVL